MSLNKYVSNRVIMKVGPINVDALDYRFENFNDFLQFLRILLNIYQYSDPH